MYLISIHSNDLSEIEESCPACSRGFDEWLIHLSEVSDYTSKIAMASGGTLGAGQKVDVGFSYACHVVCACGEVLLEI